MVHGGTPSVVLVARNLESHEASRAEMAAGFEAMPIAKRAPSSGLHIVSASPFAYPRHAGIGLVAGVGTTLLASRGTAR